MPFVVPEPLASLTNFWCLGDFAGEGSTLHDCWGDDDGAWTTTPGISQGTGGCGQLPGEICHGGSVCLPCNPCRESGFAAPDLPVSLSGCGFSYEQSGWTRSGRAGGSASVGYDHESFTFCIFARLAGDVADPGCPGVRTDFQILNLGPGCYNYYGCDGACDPPLELGDRIQSGRAIGDSTATIWKASSPVDCAPYTTCIDDLHPPFNPAADDFWIIDDEWMSCYGIFLPYHVFGIAGDHKGFPENSGWMMYTSFTPEWPDHGIFDQSIFSTNCQHCPAYGVRLFAESNGAEPPLDIACGLADGHWHMYSITSDGSTVRTYMDAIPVGYGPANRLVPGASLGFGYVDRIRALSGKDELWQGGVSNAMMFDRALTRDELLYLFSFDWCEVIPTHGKVNLKTTHRAEPQEAASADHSSLFNFHLSGSRFRADPTDPPAGSASGLYPGHLEDVRFRAE